MKTFAETILMPQQTVIGPGKALSLLQELQQFGPRGVLVYGHSLAKNSMLERILGNSLSSKSICLWQHSGGEPSLAQLDALLESARKHEPDWIAAVGGGSVMDLAKAAAGLLHAPNPLTVYHDGKPIDPSFLPFIAVPTTAGTGSEATQVAVLTNQETGVKKSIRHPSFMPRLVVLDSTLLASCPRTVIAAAGMDALTQAIEAFISRKSHWFSDQCALKAIELIINSIEAVYADSTSDAAEPLLQGSYLAGIALGNARLGLVHGLAHPLGARYNLPHGLVCALCLPYVLAFNKPVISDKYKEMCYCISRDILDEIYRLGTALHIPNAFRRIECTDQDNIIAETLASGSTAANPRDVSAQDVEIILETLFLAG